MTTFLPEIHLDKFQAEAIASGLFAVARSDGLHEREAALVAGFWADTGGSVQALSELSRRDAITAQDLAAALPEQQARVLFLKTAVLLSWADGTVSQQEKDVIAAYAAALGLTDQLPKLETEVKEYLLGHLSHIYNVEAVAQVAKKLEL